ASPSSSRMSESSSSCSATFALRGSVFATAAMIRPVHSTVCLPTYNERDNLEPMLRALGEYGVRVLVIDDNPPDGTRKLAHPRPPCRALPRRGLPPPPEGGGARPRLYRRLSSGSGRRRRTDPGDGRRLLARPEGRAAADRGHRRRRPRDWLALGRRRRHRKLG